MSNLVESLKSLGISENTAKFALGVCWVYPMGMLDMFGLMIENWQ